MTERTCIVDGCERKQRTRSRDLCERHYQAWRFEQYPPTQSCAVADCEYRGILRRGLCGKHYVRWQKYGDPTGRHRAPDPAERLLANSYRADDGSGCLRWAGEHGTKGYGGVSIGGKNFQTHRVAYELWVGPIPDGLEIDHVYARGCRHRDCNNPAHLEAVTHAENVRRRHRTHCTHGHELTPENTIHRKTPTGTKRVCLECLERWRRKSRSREKDRRSVLRSAPGT